jgi:hypothetical protein
LRLRLILAIFGVLASAAVILRHRVYVLADAWVDRDPAPVSGLPGRSTT